MNLVHGASRAPEATRPFCTKSQLRSVEFCAVFSCTTCAPRFSRSTTITVSTRPWSYTVVIEFTLHLSWGSSRPATERSSIDLPASDRPSVSPTKYEVYGGCGAALSGLGPSLQA